MLLAAVGCRLVLSWYCTALLSLSLPLSLLLLLSLSLPLSSLLLLLLSYLCYRLWCLSAGSL